MSLQWNPSFSVNHFEVGGHQVVVLGELGQVLSQEGRVEQLVGNVKVIKSSRDSENDGYLQRWMSKRVYDLNKSGTTSAHSARLYVICSKGQQVYTNIEQEQKVSAANFKG